MHVWDATGKYLDDDNNIPGDERPHFDDHHLNILRHGYQVLLIGKL